MKCIFKDAKIQFAKNTESKLFAVDISIYIIKRDVLLAS